MFSFDSTSQEKRCAQMELQWCLFIIHSVHSLSVKLSNQCGECKQIAPKTKQFTVSSISLPKMDAKADKNLHRLERKAILEAEKRKKPGECLKVPKKTQRNAWIFKIIDDFFHSMFKQLLTRTSQTSQWDRKFLRLPILAINWPILWFQEPFTGNDLYSKRWKEQTMRYVLHFRSI